MRQSLLATGGAAALLVSLAACGGSGSDAAAAGSTTSSGSPMTSSMSSPMSSASSGMASSGMASGSSMASAHLVGPGCAAYAKQVPTGAGSVQGMAQDPVATAASHNPLLTTLVKAVSGKLNRKVNLVDTLNGGQFTVFAPVDSAFAKVPAATLKTLSKNSALLTKVLTYHVVQGRLTPSQVVGTHKTVEGAPVKVTGTGSNLRVNSAHVICGGVQTANATVYLIDSVLMPPAS